MNARQIKGDQMQIWGDDRSIWAVNGSQLLGRIDN